MPARHEEGPKTPQQKQEKLKIADSAKLIDGRRTCPNASEELQQHLTINLQILRNNRRSTNTAFELYPMYKEELSITHFYPTPNMIRSLLPTNALKIASGGVHNLCVIEGNTNSLPCALYNCFMSATHTDFTFIVEGTSIKVHRVVLVYRSQTFSHFFTTNKDQKEEELKGVHYKPFRMLIDYIYLNDLTLLETQGLDKELIEVYKLAKKYGINTLADEVSYRLNSKLRGICVEGIKDSEGILIIRNLHSWQEEIQGLKHH
jgi:hypothetical protein